MCFVFHLKLQHFFNFLKLKMCKHFIASKGLKIVLSVA